MKVWLDDIRPPWQHGCIGWEWVKTGAEAIALLTTGNVTAISLDHDLGWEHYPGSGIPESEWVEVTGYHVMCWMEEHNVWPDFISIHTANPVGRERMQRLLDKHHRDMHD